MIEANRRNNIMKLVCLAAALISAQTCLAQALSERATISEIPTLTKENRLAWFKQAKFGLFIHWGPYAQLAGEWKGQRLETGQIAEWIMHTYRNRSLNDVIRGAIFRS